MNRKPIFDAVRAMLSGPDGELRGFTKSEVKALDAAIDAALAGDDGPEIVVTAPGAEPAHRIGKLSEKYETGGRGPGTVSSGVGDPGGVSYGCYQLASKTPTLGAFLKSDGAPWAAELTQGGAPGSPGFSARWKGVAAREPTAFAAAQHAFIERTHYHPAVAAVKRATGADLDAMHPAIRDAAWSCAVQHGRAANILAQAVRRVGTKSDRALIEAIYDARVDYVRGLRTMGAKTLNSLINRYANERADALAMLED